MNCKATLTIHSHLVTILNSKNTKDLGLRALHAGKYIFLFLKIADIWGGKFFILTTGWGHQSAYWCPHLSM